MSRLVLANANLIGWGERPPCRATVVVYGETIEAVLESPPAASPADRFVDLKGRTLMPGMVLGHFHAAYRELGSVAAPFGLEAVPALHAMRAAAHFKMALDSGFTGVIGAGVPDGIDAAMKAAIEEGSQIGPRIFACGHNVGTTGFSTDGSFPSHWEIGANGGLRRCDGPEGFRRAVRQEIKDGAEIIKLFLTGGHGSTAPTDQWEMSLDELHMAVRTAAERGAKVRAHTTGREAILHAIEAGIHIIDHADGMDDDCIEKCVKHGTFVAPSLLFPRTMMRNAAGSAYAEGMRAAYSHMVAILPRANAAGVRLILGDDHGAMGMPHGEYAQELELYVKDVGIPPLDVIRWATRNGAAAMGLADKCGTIEPGRLADLLVVDGDPVNDISVLRDRSKLMLVMKGGVACKDELDRIGAVPEAARPLLATA